MKDYTIYVDEELAKKAVSKGYPCFIATFPFAPEESTFVVRSMIGDECYYFPTAEQICGWLREEHNIHICIGESPITDYKYKCVGYSEDARDYGKVTIGNDYKETLLECIDKTLDLIS